MNKTKKKNNNHTKLLFSVIFPISTVVLPVRFESYIVNSRLEKYFSPSRSSVRSKCLANQTCNGCSQMFSKKRWKFSREENIKKNLSVLFNKKKKIKQKLEKILWNCTLFQRPRANQSAKRLHNNNIYDFLVCLCSSSDYLVFSVKNCLTRKLLEKIRKKKQKSKHCCG
jgi:hypothetical protein